MTKQANGNGANLCFEAQLRVAADKLRGNMEPSAGVNRTYLYADNIAIDEGRQQPVPFRPGKPMRMTDAHGAELSVTIVDILGRSALIEYQPFKP